MNYGTYNYFLNQLISLKPEIKQIRAVGTDGELALCNALKDCFPQAIHLRRLKHIKDAIERKLYDLKFEKSAFGVIVADMFGTVGDKVRQLGLADAKDPEDFFSNLMSLEKKWNGLEIQHWHFLSGQNRQPCFYEWFCVTIAPFFLRLLCRALGKVLGLDHIISFTMIAANQ